MCIGDEEVGICIESGVGEDPGCVVGIGGKGGAVIEEVGSILKVGCSTTTGVVVDIGAFFIEVGKGVELD